MHTHDVSSQQRPGLGNSPPPGRCALRANPHTPRPASRAGSEAAAGGEAEGSRREPDPSSLDGLETSTHPLANQSWMQRRLHQHHAAARERIVNALWRTADGGLRKRATKLSWCGWSPWLTLDSSGHVGLHIRRCRERACPLCQARRADEARRRAEQLTQRMDACRFVTLTLRADNASLTDRLLRLRAAWKQLRRLRWWCDRVTGGFYGVEVTRGREGKHWHVHLHALVDGQYLDQRTLSDLWLQCTGNSPIVDVRAVPARRQAARYVSKYVTKPASLERWTDEQIVEWTRAVHGQRLLQAFGHLHGSTLDPADANETLPPETARYPADWLRVRVLDGETGAAFAVKALLELAPALGEPYARLIEPRLLAALRLDEPPMDVLRWLWREWTGENERPPERSRNGTDPPGRGSRCRPADTPLLWTVARDRGHGQPS